MRPRRGSVCRSICPQSINPSVRHAFSKNPRKCLFSPFSFTLFIHTGTPAHSHAFVSMHTHTQTCSWNYGNAAARCQWRATATRPNARHKMRLVRACERAFWTYQQTDGQTDRQMHAPSYRDAAAHLKRTLTQSYTYQYTEVPPKLTR